MLKKLIIKNFRCYENSTILLPQTSVLVGRNNAGKSTLIEALKILSEVSKKYRHCPFSAPPAWVNGETENGIKPSIERINISDKGLFYMYRNPPAIIEGVFDNNVSLRVYVGEELSVFALIIGPDGMPARNSKAAKAIDIPVIEVLPQISAVQEIETVYAKSTVDRNIPTRLSSRNFRNQLFYYKEHFDQFKRIAEDTWEHLQVKPLESSLVEGGRMLQFYVRDNSFESEIAWMGHGLQMWLQTMWFISRCNKDCIVVLDEPDVYMHADLQRRLIRMVSHMFSQLIIATHSVEIMEEVTAKSIIPVDSKRRRMKPIGSHEILQQLTDEMGSSVNLNLSRMFLSRRFIIWEGKDTDRQILSSFQSILFPKDIHPISTFPNIYVEGWGGWQRALAVAEVFKKNFVGVKCYCIFDADYHSKEVIEARQKDAADHRVNLHIWHRKEIENYVLHPTVIVRYIQQNKRKGQISESIVGIKMKEIADSMKESFIADVANEIKLNNPKLSVGAALQLAKNTVHDRWEENPMQLLPGKKVLKELSAWSKTNFGVSFNALNIVKSFQIEEIPEEVKVLISAIIAGTPLE